MLLNFQEWGDKLNSKFTDHFLESNEVLNGIILGYIVLLLSHPGPRQNHAGGHSMKTWLSNIFLVSNWRILGLKEFFKPKLLLLKKCLFPFSNVKSFESNDLELIQWSLNEMGRMMAAFGHGIWGKVVAWVKMCVQLFKSISKHYWEPIMCQA